MVDQVREVSCPECGGRVRVVERPHYIDAQAAPVRWSVIEARCENRCDLEDGAIRPRQA
jgi:DNA-directed RNA polymerase subunit RPC12/RpoP